MRRQGAGAVVEEALEVHDGSLRARRRLGDRRGVARALALARSATARGTEADLLSLRPRSRWTELLRDQALPVLIEERGGILRVRRRRRDRDPAAVGVEQQHDRVAVSGVLGERPTGGRLDGETVPQAGEVPIVGPDGA